VKHRRRIQDILGFWFGALEGPEDVADERSEIWFEQSDATDYFLRQTFEVDLVAARRGEREEWKQEPRPSLAWILLLDQFSRNIYRGFPAAYETDLTCQIQTLEGIEAGFDRELLPIERVFYYLPLEHAEDLEVQERSVQEFSRLLEDAPASRRAEFEHFLGYARRHHAVIERFGRFPHRNAVLGRESTEEELAFMAEHGTGF